MGITFIWFTLLAAYVKVSSQQYSSVIFSSNELGFTPHQTMAYIQQQLPRPELGFQPTSSPTQVGMLQYESSSSNAGARVQKLRKKIQELEMKLQKLKKLTKKTKKRSKSSQKSNGRNKRRQNDRRSKTSGG